MADDSDRVEALLLDEQRLKFFVNLLRASSLDKLHEMLNLFMGQMSLIESWHWLMKHFTMSKRA
jgi:lipopolysaccharide/colanic/teichoic acid biosynthesis glycosyltransferase